MFEFERSPLGRPSANWLSFCPGWSDFAKTGLYRNITTIDIKSICDKAHNFYRI